MAKTKSITRALTIWYHGGGEDTNRDFTISVRGTHRVLCINAQRERAEQVIRDYLQELADEVDNA